MYHFKDIIIYVIENEFEYWILKTPQNYVIQNIYINIFEGSLYKYFFKTIVVYKISDLEFIVLV